jgi:hypothetical protein
MAGIILCLIVGLLNGLLAVMKAAKFDSILALQYE